MLFQAMVLFLSISMFFKILSERGKVHCRVCHYKLPCMVVQGGRAYFATDCNRPIRIALSIYGDFSRFPNMHSNNLVPRLSGVERRAWERGWYNK